MFGAKGELRLCSEYLREGIIFRDQPYCCQGGIITYAFVLVLRMLAGGAFSNILYFCVVLLLNLHALFLLLRIIQHETGKTEYFLTGIFYLLTIYIFGGNITTFLTAYFSITGFYVLWHSKLKYRDILGPVLYACALFSKATAMPVVSFLAGHMVFMAFQPHIESRKIVFKKDWRSAGVRLLSFGVILALVFLLFPGSWVYEFGNQGSRLQESVQVQLQQLLDSLVLNSGTMFFGLIFLLSVIAFFFLRDVYSAATVFSIAVLFWVLFGQRGLATDNGLMFAINRIDYYLASYPFFIVAMAKLKHKLNNKMQLKWGVGILLALFLATTIQFISADRDIRLMEERFKSALSLIPPQEDYVLTEDPLGDILIDKYYDPKAKIDVIPHYNVWKEGVLPDGNFYRKMDELGVTNSSAWMLPQPQQEWNVLFSKLLNDTYSIIFINVPQKITLMRMIQNAPNVANYCVVLLPDLQFHTHEGDVALILLFQDKKRCEQMMPKIKQYYEASFADICKRSPVVANNIVRNVLGQEGITLPECKGTADSLLFFNRKSARLRLSSILLAALLTWIVWIGNIPRMRFSSPGESHRTSSKNP
ncbi:MAG: hypothetical protein QXR48_01640 [Candidatus Woesearchaeota archaeon]